MCLKIAGWVANSVDTDEMQPLWHLIWVYSVYSGLSVGIHAINTVLSKIVVDNILKKKKKKKKEQNNFFLIFSENNTWHLK